MTKPQQPEIARSGRSDVDPSAAKTRHGGPTDTTGTVGVVPEENLPGHHPDHEQDKPEGPPPKPQARRPKATATAKATAKGAAGADKVVDLRASSAADDEEEAAHFDFDFDPLVGAAGLAFGVTPWTTGLDVKDGKLHVRFGPFALDTPVDNVLGAEVTGPYSYLKVAGPPHISLADRGVTFATTTKRGVCIRFRNKVGLLRHPAVTVTVDEPERLVEVLAGS